MRKFSDFCARARAFFKTNAGNVTVIFVLSAVPITLAMGAGVDYARSMVVHSNMNDALDAAGLAVGAAGTKPTACSSDGSSSASTGNGPSGTPTACAPMQQIAQQYFDANFRKDSASDTVSPVKISIVNQSVVLTVTDDVPTTFLHAADYLMGSGNLENMHVVASTTIVWGQTKLWVSLVLDNTGSMCEPHSQPCTTDTSTSIKINALKSASHSLLATLQNASTTPGDVMAAIVPFAKDVNVGTVNVGASWIDWSDWNTQIPSSQTPSANVGPGDSCPFSSSYDNCLTQPGGVISATDKVTMTTTNTVPNSGTYSGYICPGSNSSGHYYNGCFTSTASTVTDGPRSGASCSGYTHCSCINGGTSSKTCTATIYAHTWVLNPKSTWRGCVMDRTQDDDTTNATPGSTFPAENSDYCTPAAVTLMSNPAPTTTSAMTSMFANLNTQVDAMIANGNTNQAIGLAHGWQALTNGLPYSAPTLPANTTRYIILISDGLNTQDRWYSSASQIDARQAIACTNAKTAGVVIYTIYVDLGGSSSSTSVPLSNCATDSSKYFHLTTTGAIITTFNNIAAQITNLRVSM